MNKAKKEINEIFGNKIRIRVCGICVVEGKILLVKHAGLGEAGELWSAPGGGIVFEESVLKCLEREFLEETGYKIRVKEFLFVNEFFKSPLHSIELFFEVEIIEGNLKVGDEPEIKEKILKEVKWLSEKELKNIQQNRRHSIFQNDFTLPALVLQKGYSYFIN